MQSALTSWQLWALLSAAFAALTAIFAKVGVENVNSDFATWCLSGWLSSIQHLVGGRGVPGGQAEQGLERGHGRAASVETEHEFVDVVGQMFGADAVVGAEQPGFEVGEGPVDPGQLLGGVLRVPDHGRPVRVGPAQGPVGMQAIGQDGAAWSDRFFGEAGEGRGRQVGYDGEPDPSRAVAADLDRAGQDRLLAVALPAAAPPFLDPAYIGLVQLH